MRLKIPRKKYRLPTFVGMVLILALSVVPWPVPATDSLAGDRDLFWSIQKNGRPVGHLLGTIHSEDPRVLDFPETFLLELRENNIFAMELVPDLPTLSRLAEYMRYPKGRTLEEVVGEARYKALVSALSTYNISPDHISRLKPWAAMMTLSTPPPETGFFMDLSLSLRASGSGLTVIGLETLDQQLSFLDEMPMPMQLALLDQAIAESGEVVRAHDEMVDTYLANDLAELQALSEEQLKGVSEEAGDYFIESGINARNLRMMESLLPHLEHDRVFVAVGALHLPGDKGLLSLLRLNGFELKPLDMPFAVKPPIAGE